MFSVSLLIIQYILLGIISFVGKRKLKCLQIAEDISRIHSQKLNRHIFVVLGQFCTISFFLLVLYGRKCDVKFQLTIPKWLKRGTDLFSLFLTQKPLLIL